MKVLDVSCGGRMFWFDKKNPDTIYCDIRKENHILCDGRSFNICPNVICDFTDLPFKDGYFNMVIFDPPHLIKCGKKSWLAKKYGILGKDWKQDVKTGFKECFRVLKDAGTLVFKWSEKDILVSEILKLTTEKPVVGHKSGKLNNTHWICFLKLTPMAK